MVNDNLNLIFTMEDTAPRGFAIEQAALSLCLLCALWLCIASGNCFKGGMAG